MHVEGFHLQDSTGIVVEASSQSEVDIELCLERLAVELAEDILQLFDTLHAHFRLCQCLAQSLQLALVCSFEQDDRLQAGYGIVAQTLAAQLLVYLVESHLVELVDGYGNIDNLIGSTYDFGDTGKNFAVVEFDSYANVEAAEYIVDDVQQLHLVEQRVGADDVAVALIELTVATLLRAVGAPHGLYLVTLEGECEFVAVHNNIASKGHSEVISQSLLAQAGCQAGSVALAQLGIFDTRKEVARVENFEKEFITFFAIFSHQGLQCLHCRSFDGAETVEGIYLTNGIEYIVAFGHLLG